MLHYVVFYYWLSQNQIKAFKPNPSQLNFESLKNTVLFQEFYFPEHVGFPIGTPDSSKVVILEVHYDNPQEREGMDHRKVFLRCLYSGIPNEPFFSKFIKIYHGHNINQILAFL